DQDTGALGDRGRCVAQLGRILSLRILDRELRGRKPRLLQRGGQIRRVKFGITCRRYRVRENDRDVALSRLSERLELRHYRESIVEIRRGNLWHSAAAMTATSSAAAAGGRATARRRDECRARGYRHQCDLLGYLLQRDHPFRSWPDEAANHRRPSAGPAAAPVDLNSRSPIMNTVINIGR